MQASMDKRALIIREHQFFRIGLSALRVQVYEILLDAYQQCPACNIVGATFSVDGDQTVFA